MAKVPVKRGSVKARSSFFEGLVEDNTPEKDKKDKEESPADKIGKPKWMQDLARKTDAHDGVVDKQLKSKLRERKMITDGRTPKKLPPRESQKAESPELAAMLQKARARAEAEAEAEEN